MSGPCPCGSEKSLEDCCAPYINGAAHPKTPGQLMRSRYTAYALGGHGDYLLATWFPATARGLTPEALSKRDREWTRLQIVDKQQRGDQGFVEFKAYYREGDGEEHIMHEKSVFQRSGGRWLYVGGEVTSAPSGD